MSCMGYLSEASRARSRAAAYWLTYTCNCSMDKDLAGISMMPCRAVRRTDRYSLIVLEERTMSFASMF